MTPSTATPPLLQPLKRAGDRVASPVRQLGHIVVFAGKAIAGVPVVLRSYRKEYTRLLADVAWGNGSLVVGGGTAGVALVLGVVVGVMVGIEGYNFLQLLGLGPAVGIISSLVNTRELAPIACALAFATQSGCRFTAQLVAMRISEEIDALDSTVMLGGHVPLDAGALFIDAPGGLWIEVLSGKPDIQGNRTTFSGVYDATSTRTLPAGDYRVRVEYEGDAPDKEADATVTAGERTEIKVE